MSDFRLSALLRRFGPLRFVAGWIGSRRWQTVVAGIPAVAAGLVGLMLHLEASRTSGSDRAHHYVRSARMTLVHATKDRKPEELHQDLEEASLWYRRALVIDPDNSEAKYGIAELAAARGNRAGARDMMEELANRTDSTGDLANLWIVNELHAVLSTTGTIPDSERRAFLKRVERVVATDPKQPAAQRYLGLFHLASGEIDKAVPHLKIAASAFPALHRQLAAVYRSQKQTDLAEQSLKAAEEGLRRLLEEKPDDVELCLDYAGALADQKKYREAEATLAKGLQQTKSEKLARGLSLLYAGWAVAQHQAKAIAPSPLELIGQSLAIDPTNVPALTLLMEFSEGESSDAAKAKEDLETRLAAGEVPWLIHLALGTRRANEGDAAVAQTHLESALKLNPKAAATLNNLAYLLAHRPEPDLERALELANAAVELQPKSAELRETRGQILVKLSRASDGLADLELALPAFRRNPRLKAQLPAIHTAMATAYEQLGNASMAAKHRELATAATSAAGSPSP